MTKQVFEALILSQKIKLQTVKNVILSQTVPVKKNGEMAFPETTKKALKAAAVNPMDYVLQS